jgi:hypothetical protein
MVVLDYGWRSVIEVIVSLQMSASSDLQLLSRRTASGQSGPYDECPLLGLAVPERIVANPPIAEIRTETLPKIWI